MKKLLFVDDEANILEGYERLLWPERRTWSLLKAGSVREATAILAEENVDAIISDYNMPGQSGFDLLTRVRATSDIPLVIITGSAESGLKREALELGATDLLSKPVDREDLVARIRNVLRIKEYQDAIKEHNQRLEELVAERTAQLVASRHEIIWRLAKAAESKDEDTGNHVIRVGCYCRVIAEALEMPEEFVELIFLASPLHDIGKIGVPDRVLLKPGKLDDEEWKIMRSHAQVGANILCHDLEIVMAINGWAPASLANVPMQCHNPILEMAAEIAVAHHEKWDGTGYPNGISGEQIPITARIVAIADVYDALTSERPYKRAFTEEEALAIIDEGRGRHFDPRIVDAFYSGLPRIREIRAHFADHMKRVEAA
jgi:putative two-component system response regulator